MEKTIDKIHKMKLGRVRTWITRLSGYLSILNFGMILYTFVLGNPLGISSMVWIILAGVGVPLIMLFDIIIMMPSELEYGYDKNKRFIDLEGKIDKIINLVEEGNGKKKP